MSDKIFSPTRLRRAANRRRRLHQPRKLVFETCEDRRMLAVLGVTIDRSTVLEYAGDGAANATIERDDTAGALTIQLTSSDENELTVQDSVTLLDGVGAVKIPLNVIDDDVLDGTKTVSITASADGFTEGSDTIDVRDIETLSFSVDATSIAIGEATTATLRRNNTDVDESVLVNIQDLHAADLVIPDQVEIPAGQSEVEIPISAADNGVVDGTRTVSLVVFSDGYLNDSDTLEIREEGVVGVEAAADGFAIDVNQDKSFSTIVATGAGADVRAGAQERRALFEFDVSSIAGPLDGASLTLKTRGYSARNGVGPTIELYGYVADGSLSSGDAVSGQKVAEFQIPGDSGIRRYGIPLDLEWLQPLLGVHEHLGFSARIADGFSAGFSTSRDRFTHESNQPMLQFLSSELESPTAVRDAVKTDEDRAVTIDVLANDFGEELLITSTGTASNGSVIVNNDQTITYTPTPNYNGVDLFEYSIRDTNGDTDSATVTVTVLPVNDSPRANNDTATVDEDDSVTIDVIANDTDVDDDDLSIDRVTGPSHGSVVINEDQTITYSPDTNYNGGDSFIYSLTDGNGGFYRAFVNVTVDPVNDSPEAVDAVFELEENSPNGTELGRIEASDVEEDDLAFELSGDDADAFAIDADGVLSVANFALLDFETHPEFDFDVLVSDRNGGETTAGVHVDLTDVLEVAIDIRPGDDRNRVRLNSRRIKVAILASETFDPFEMVDLSTVRLRAEGSSTAAEVTTKRRGGYRFKRVDVNGDGRLDLVLKFNTSDTGLQSDDTSLRLEGNLLPEFGGGAFAIDQTIEVVSRRRRK